MVAVAGLGVSFVAVLCLVLCTPLQNGPVSHSCSIPTYHQLYGLIYLCAVTSCLDVDGGGCGGGYLPFVAAGNIASTRIFLPSVELGNRLSPRRAASSASFRVFTFLPYTNCRRSGLRLSVYIWMRSSSA